MRDLKPNDVGRKFSAEIQETPVTGKIQLNGVSYYLCQNEKDGSSCSDKLGYKYSWSVHNGSISQQEKDEVENLLIKF